MRCRCIWASVGCASTWRSTGEAPWPLERPPLTDVCVHTRMHHRPIIKPLVLQPCHSEGSQQGPERGAACRRLQTLQWESALLCPCRPARPPGPAGKGGGSIGKGGGGLHRQWRELHRQGRELHRQGREGATPARKRASSARLSEVRCQEQMLLQDGCYRKSDVSADYLRLASGGGTGVPV